YAHRIAQEAAQMRSALAASQLVLAREERLAALGGLLGSLSYKGVLERGFALVKTEAGKIARRAGDLPVTGVVSLVFADGERAAHLGEAPPKRAAAKRPVQKGLFD
ncbi:MAG TPA: exodeoxyribonuclease VII large subunit, partial [Parvularcula sp.]|nr:exodeoxyribonuclease VII large subunit [Parvularcula sp.]